MTTQELSANFAANARRLGGVSDGALVASGKYTAFPHGSVQPQKLREGDVVLPDGGCTVQGYVSDITRPTVSARPPSGNTTCGSWRSAHSSQDLRRRRLAPPANRWTPPRGTCSSQRDPEDCIYITESGPRWFTPQSPAIDRPV